MSAVRGELVVSTRLENEAAAIFIMDMIERNYGQAITMPIYKRL
jgi:hypothetical protein